MKIKNRHYKKFLKGQMIRKIPPEDLKKVLDNIEHEHQAQARALVIVSWLTGARPNEVLRLKGNDIIKEPYYLKIELKGSKRSKNRTLMLPIRNNDLVKELWSYIQTVPGPVFLFWAFRSSRVRHGTTVTHTKKIDGKEVKEKKHYDKKYRVLSDKLYYWFKKWFSVLFEDGVPPYYLRHNRSSVMAENCTAAEIAQARGSTISSAEQYIHLSEKQAKKIGRELIR